MKRMLIIALLLNFTIPAFAADLVVFSGAGLMKPMEEMRKNFQGRHKIEAEVHYGSSGEIFGMLAGGQPCDVLIPGAEKYTEDALKNGWLKAETVHKMVRHVPVITVPAGNPAGVKRIEDLTREGVKVSIGDPRAPAIGRVARKILQNADLWEAIQPNISVYAPTANQLLIYVALSQVDAAINWKDLTTWSEGRGKIEVVPISDRYNEIKTIPTAVCSQAPHPKTAQAFNDYIASEEGLRIWAKWGFEPCHP